MEGVYWLAPEGSAFEAWCDMENGGWTLVWSMCQDGGGSVTNPVRTTPLMPSKHLPVSALSYAPVEAMEPTSVRFGSDFREEPGYLLSWDDVTGTVNQLQKLLDGDFSGDKNECLQYLNPLEGSNGEECVLVMQHNNSNSEPYDIPSLGCNCGVWNYPLLWGQIDGLTQFNGVSHRLSKDEPSDGVMTTDGCLHVYVK